MDTKKAKEYVEKINIEEAIKVFKNLIKMNSLFNRGNTEIDFYSKVIEFLERGKKYEEMWEEIEGITGAIEWEMLDLKEIKQQYFPELIKVVKWELLKSMVKNIES